MKHTYWVKYPRNFSNEYNLVAASDEIEGLYLKSNGYERISYKRMRELCFQEKYRRKMDPSSSGYAPISPIPYKEVGLI